ncbi:hypothetical protein ACFQV2_24110 [Actinokineospora soli]|uniref:Uncharacterized protein n=1 Tax=Actinokineospora soli TaxID=1048753 RepID=A0ABW2TQJ6_9PSEU
MHRVRFEVTGTTVVPFDAHFLGGSATHGTRVPLLGCSCGDLGCWPLLAHVGVADGRVVWDLFEQPFRPDRDYDRFGPFRFDLRQYRDALAEPGAP